MIKVSFAFEDLNILNQQSLLLQSGDRLGVLGTNGQGKSTLLKLIAGKLEAQSGKVKYAHNVQIAYFDQLREQIDYAQDLKTVLADGSDQIDYQGKSVHIISWAKRFGFERHDLQKKMADLSGGEQARVLLSILVRQDADVLILDEPTNDLDIPMLEALEDMILAFEGVIVLVTHDRYVLEKVCSKFLGYTKNQELLPYASYQQWEDSRNQSVASKPSQPEKVKTKKMTEAERKEYNKIERKITRAEERLEALQMEACLLYTSPSPRDS